MADRMWATNEGGGDFEVHPDGQHTVRCVDLIDLGERFDENFGKVSKKCALVFASGATDKAGKLLTVQQEFTLSSAPLANLRKFLEQWRGRTYSDEEATRIPLHKLEGTAALVVIEHRQSKSKRTFANIKSIMMLPKGMPEPTITGYERGEWWSKKRETYAEGVAKYRAQRAAAPDIADDDGFDDFPPPDDDQSLPF